MNTLGHVTSPITGEVRHAFDPTPPSVLDEMAVTAQAAFLTWRTVPAPKRGELIRRFGLALRANQEELAHVITEDSGKILAEARGEVQEMIDICDFAVGLSRQLHGLTIASERPGHRMMEQRHPLGPVLVVSAFNFPAAVWAWNFALAIVCGDPVVWKPSEKTADTALFCHGIFAQLANMFGAPPGLSQVAFGGAEAGARLAARPEFRLVSATGSSAMGRAIARATAGDLGKRLLLELGGNNAMIVAPSADLDLAARAIVFSAAGTAGQRCTTLRRLIVHGSVRDALMRRLVPAYASIRVGDPRVAGTLVGPLIDRTAAERMDAAIRQAIAEGGRVAYGGKRPILPHGLEGAYRHPAIVEMPAQTAIVREETFAPILYVMTYDALDDAIAMQNGVAHGLSSSIFTNDVREAEAFLSATGSDCGIANVNIGPSGAEIGGAFGGEKDTGGGRESGSDAWKNYTRPATNTINYSGELPLAQGVTFDVE